MKALKIRQPWSWAIIHGQKSIENRTWSISYRGPLLIVSSKSIDVTAYDSPLLSDAPRNPPLMAALGVVKLIDILPWDHPDLVGNPWVDRGTPGGVCWVLSNPRPVKQFEVRDAQVRVFEVADEKIAYLG